MATITGKTAHANWDFKLEVTEASTDIAANTSSVKVTAYIGRNTVSSYMYGAKISCKVSVTGVSSKTISYSNANRVNVAVGGWLNIGSVTFTGVPHNSDGSKTVTVSASFTNNVSPASGSASGSFTLTTLPRKSALSVSNGTLDTELTLTIDRKATSFTHTITYKCGNASGTVVSKTTAMSVKWTPPLSLASQNTTGTTVSVTFTITTYSGSTNIGSNTKAITCSIPPKVKPSCSISLEDVTGLETTYGAPVQSLSRIKIKVDATTSYGSPINSYAVSADGANYTTAENTTEALKASGSVLISATVKDKRGRSGSASEGLTVLAYCPPNVSKLTVHRCEEDGTENDQGEFVRVTFSAEITALNDKNLALYTLRYRKSTESGFTAVTLSDLFGIYSVVDHSYVFPADSNSSYEVEIEAKDNHGIATRSTSASTAFTLINWGPSGTSMAIGKVAEKEGVLDVALDLEVHQPIELNGETLKVLTITDDFKLYSGDSDNQPTAYKNAAGMVELVGRLSPNKTLSDLGATTGVVMFTLPEGFRPAVSFTAVEQGSSSAVWLITVETSGEVKASQYRKGDSYEVPDTDAWMPFHQVFFAGK